MTHIQLTLYVAGHSIRSRQAIQNLHQICETELADRYELAIIDILQNPQAAEDAKILATPTLILEHPLPKRRIVGDLADHQQVLIALNIYAEGDKHD